MPFSCLDVTIDHVGTIPVRSVPLPSEWQYTSCSPIQLTFDVSPTVAALPDTAASDQKHVMTMDNQTLPLLWLSVALTIVMLSSVKCARSPVATPRVLNAAARLEVRQHLIRLTWCPTHWLPIPQRIEYSGVLVFNCVRGVAPVYLSTMCQPVSDNLSRRRLHAAVPARRTAHYGPRSFADVGSSSSTIHRTLKAMPLKITSNNNKDKERCQRRVDPSDQP